MMDKKLLLLNKVIIVTVIGIFVYINLSLEDCKDSI